MKKVSGLVFVCLPLLAADYTTYIGGTFPALSFEVSYDVSVAAMTTDAAGNTYLTGGLNTNTLQTGAGPFIAFVTKLEPGGNLVFSKVFGGSGSDQGTAIAVDPAGNIYVGGSTSSPDLLLSNALLTTATSNFILKLSPDGNTVLYMTYFGAQGPGAGTIAAMATDANGNLYLTGTTWAPEFPTTPGMPADRPFGYTAAFITELSAAGDSIVYSGLIGGTTAARPTPPPMSACGFPVAATAGSGVAVDAKGAAYFAGTSNTADLIGTAGVLAPQGYGAFVGKVQPGGGGLAYLTYVSDGAFNTGCAFLAENVVNAIAVDSAGNAYLTGSTDDSAFPATRGGYQTSLAGSSPGEGTPPPTDAFVAKLAPDASHMVWATYLGGEADDSAQSIAVDSSGNVWTSGTTASVAFPNANGWSSGGDFLVEVNPSGSALVYAARYPSQTVDVSVGLDSATGLIHAAGPTGIVSGVAPTQAPTMRAFGLVNMAGGEITGRVAWGEMVSIYGPHIGPTTPLNATVDSSGALPTVLGGVQVTFGGTSAPLLYVSDSQINLIVPTLTDPATLQITNGPTTSPGFPADPLLAVPQVFRNANLSAAAVNQDGTLNSSSNPAKGGSMVTIWATGTGELPIPAGEIATTASDSCNCLINIYGSHAPGPFTQQATVVYAGASPGFASGFMEVIFVVPPGLGGLLYFNLSVLGTAGNPVWLYATN